MAEGKSLAAALAASDALGEYRGRKVLSTSLKITNTGDGLSEAMGIAPEILEPGDTVYVLLECEVGKHTHKLNTKFDAYELQQVLKAGTATIVDDQASKKKIAAQANRLQRAKEEREGTQRIPGTEDVTDGQDNVTAIDSKSAAAGERPDPEWDDDPPSD